MAISYSIYEASNIIPNLSFRQSFSLADLVIEFPASHVVQDENDAVLFLVDFVDVDDAGVVEADEHVDLMPGFYKVGLVNFGCEGLSSVPANAFADG